MGQCSQGKMTGRRRSVWAWSSGEEKNEERRGFCRSFGSLEMGKIGQL